MCRTIFGAVLAVVLVIVAAQSPAHAQVKPFQVTGAGVVDFIPLPGEGPAYHFADGVATHLGKYHADGFVQADMFTSPTTATFFSAVPVVFTAADGDELHFDYAGEVELIPSDDGTFITVWIAEFTPADGSTGRFEKVIGGSFIMTAVTAPFTLDDREDVAYSWSGNGELEFAPGN